VPPQLVDTVPKLKTLQSNALVIEFAVRHHSCSRRVYRIPRDTISGFAYVITFTPCPSMINSRRGPFPVYYRLGKGPRAPDVLVVELAVRRLVLGLRGYRL
jgi:hypothetical protein